MDPESWGIFHDGHIEKIEGRIPGDVRLHVSVLYLRQMFPGNGRGFVVRLQGCTLCEYQEYDEEPIQDLQGIERKEPELLYVQSTVPVTIDCAMGTLRLDYQAASITLDTGEPVTDGELEAACKRYWEDWESRAKERS